MFVKVTVSTAMHVLCGFMCEYHGDATYVFAVVYCIFGKQASLTSEAVQSSFIVSFLGLQESHSGLQKFRFSM